jgi:hypothetical protein
VKVASERGGRGVLHAPLLHEAGITCSLSTDERNDEVITPTSEQIQDMRWWEWAIIEIQSGVSGYDGNSKSFQNPRSTLITPEMESLCSATQVQRRYRWSDAIKSGRVCISQVISKIQSRFSFDPTQSRSPDCFQQRGTSVRLKRLQGLQWSSAKAAEW